MSGILRNPIASRLLSAETSREGDRATTLELFFDLVYAFAFTQVTALMAHNPTPIGILQGLVMLGLLWETWSGFAWLANQVHADRGIARIGMVAAAVIVFVAALVVPHAFLTGSEGTASALVFAVAYLLIQIVHATVYLIAAGSDAGLRKQVLLTDGAAMLPAAALLVIGALVGSPFQVWIWLVAIVVQFVLIYLTSSGGNWRLQSLAHFSERHGLIVLLALGESVVAVGVGVSGVPLGIQVVVGAVLAIGIAFGLWLVYFDHLAAKTERELGRRTGVERVAAVTDTFTYLHFSLIAGIVIAALGIETTMERIAERDSLGWFAACALGGGIALYLAGTGFVWRRVSGEWALPRFGAATAALLIIPLMQFLPALGALAIAGVVVLALVVAEQLLGQRAKVPAKLPAPTS